ncbi:hypothetical protein N7507_010338 [Penicillium longicatenatum]|nr:hypothetical protein N7507_010338 [Penicillium longicatenatum]
MDQNPASPEARQSRILESPVDRLWQRSRERGRCERAATIDTLILLSLCRRTFFFRGVEILRRRELILGADVDNYQGPQAIGRVRRRTPVTPRITRIQQQVLSADTIRLQAQDERAQRIISSLPRQTVSETPQAVEDPTCIICMDPLGLNDEVMVLPCAHWFCADCTGSWFRVGNSCPMCRGAVGPNQPHNRPINGASEPTDTPGELANDLTIDEGLLYGYYHL